MKEKLMEILAELRPDLEFAGQTKLIDDGILDSLDIVSLVFELNDAFDLEITVDELVPDNFNSPEAILELIVAKQEE